MTSPDEMNPIEWAQQIDRLADEMARENKVGSYLYGSTAVIYCALKNHADRLRQEAARTQWDVDSCQI